MCWYTSARRTIETLYGDDADLFCDILAATSPRKQVKSNWKLAVRLYTAYKNGQELPTVGLMPAHKGNVNRAFSGQELSGPKVQAFAANLKGDFNRVTIDVWVLRFFGIKKSKITPKQYIALEKAIQKLAKNRGLSPARYQAEIWERSLSNAGRKPVSYTSVSEVNQKQFEFMEN